MARPNKPFRPIWDRPRPVITIEVPRPPPEVTRPPLPPGRLFGMPGHAGYASRVAPQVVLPKFEEYVPPHLIGLTERMQDASDKTDVDRLLKASNDIARDTHDAVEVLADLSDTGDVLDVLNAAGDTSDALAALERAKRKT